MQIKYYLSMFFSGNNVASSFSENALYANQDIIPNSAKTSSYKTQSLLFEKISKKNIKQGVEIYAN